MKNILAKFLTIQLCISVLICAMIASVSGQPINCYRVYLSDKANSPYSVERPDEFLSPRAISLRARYQIAITEQDLPINPEYRAAIEAISPTITILSTSKWTNTLTVRCVDETKLTDIQNLTFVQNVRPIGYYPANPPQIEETNLVTMPTLVPTDSVNYGKGYDQIALHNGHLLHQAGFRGEGMLIAMLDGGWQLFNQYPGFEQLYENGQIVGTHNFIPGCENVYAYNMHGTACASTILSQIFTSTDTLVGSAPKAQMYFIRTEDSDAEQPIEEDFLAAGLELADSIGADVITVSLGYTVFDNPAFPTDYSSCDGQTSIASIAATLAAHKGHVVCVAAGNDGAREWHKLSRPADAEDILCVGAVNVDSIPAIFTSCGPSYDGRVKPDVASCGWNTYVVLDLEPTETDDPDVWLYDMKILAGNGTSFATPLLAGLATCLWQALPQYNSLEIMQIIREAGHQYANPDTLMGYGIPDFYQAYLQHYQPVSVGEQTKETNLQLFPNPTNGRINVSNTGNSAYTIYIYDMQGRLMTISEVAAGSEQAIDMRRWSGGMYLMRCIDAKGASEVAKILYEK